MNISSVSNTSGNTYSSVGNSDGIAQLEKQKNDLEKELKEVSQSKEDAKTKQQKAQQLQNQIQQIDAQIQQLKAEKADMRQNISQQMAAASYKNSKLSKGDADNLPEQIKDRFQSSQIDVQV